MRYHHQNNLNKHTIFKDAHFVSIYQTRLMVFFIMSHQLVLLVTSIRPVLKFMVSPPLHRGVIQQFFVLWIPRKGDKFRLRT